jgi:DNA mismatch repair ATPase MutL
MAIRDLIKSSMAEIFRGEKSKEIAMSPSFDIPLRITRGMDKIPPQNIGGERNNRDIFSRDVFKPQEMVKPQKMVIAEQEMFGPNFVEEGNGCEWRFVGKVFDEIALFEAEKGIIIFNIKLAANRVLYEKIIFHRGEVDSQMLLMPIEISLLEEEMERLEYFLPIFLKHGFSIYSFGKRDYKVDAIPNWLSYQNAEMLLRNLIVGEEILEKSASETDLEETFARQISQLVNLANYREREDIENLRDKLLASSNPYLCPRGNAIYFELPMVDINLRFSKKMK